jgi:drug/metabolite transporter (DMT)-like permease
MIYLILSIICATSLVIILRLFDKWNIPSQYGIVFNYLACCITGLIALPEKSLLLNIHAWSGLWISLLLGGGFILIFILIGKSVKLYGVAVTSIAFKISFVIPMLAAVFFYGDMLTMAKMIGILIAIAAIVLITYQREHASSPNGRSYSGKAAFLPALIFIGAGIDDAWFNYIQHYHTPQGFDHIVNIAIFGGALITGILLFGLKRELYTLRNLAGGIVLGVPNYFSLYFLLKALQDKTFSPSTLFPLNNLGIVCLSSVAGILVFREQATVPKLIGFILAVSSILIIGFVR